MTIPGGYAALDVLTAANMNLLPAGKVGYAQIVATQSSITTVVDITSLTVTWTAVASRRYRTSWFFAASSTVSADIASITCCNSANTQVGVTVTAPLSTVYNYSFGGSVCETGLSGSTERKLRAIRTSATAGLISINASATAPCYIVVEDIGPA